MNRDNSATAYGAVPNLREHAQRGLRQGDVDADAHDADQRQLPRLARARRGVGRLFGLRRAARPAAAAEAWQRIGTADGSWIINDNNFATFKYTHFANPTQGVPDNVSSATVNTAIGTHLRSTTSSRWGCFTVPKPIAGNAAQNAFMQPIINRYGYLLNGVPQGGGIVGFASPADRRGQLLPRTPARSPTTRRSSTGGMRHNLHVGYQQYVDSEDLTRSSNGWGSITCPAGRSSPRAACRSSTRRPIRRRASGLVPTIHSEYHSKSIEVNDTITLEELDVQRRPARQQRHAVRPGPDTTPSAPVGLRQGDRHDVGVAAVQDVRDPVQQDDAAAPQRDLGLQRQGHACSSATPGTTRWPARCRAPRRGTATCDGDPERRLRRQRQPVRAGTIAASSSGKLFVPDMTPPTLDEWLIGTAQAVHRPARRPRLLPLPHGARTTGKTRNNMARLSCDEAGRPTVPGTDVSDSADAYIPNLTADRTQIGQSAVRRATRPTSSPSSTARSRDYQELTLEAEYRKGRRGCSGSYTCSRYYGNFDQDNSTVTTSTTPTSSSARRTSATARAASCGTTSSARCAATVRTPSSSMAPTACRGTPRSGVYVDRAVGPAVGEVELPALRGAHDQ